MNKLKEFHQDKQMMIQVQSYLFEKLKSDAIEKLLKGEDVSGYKESYKIIESSFIEIEKMFPREKEKFIPKTE